MAQWLTNVQHEAENTNNLLLREFCQQLSDYLSHGTTLHYGREKTLEFIRSCLETETAPIGILVSRGFEKLMQDEETCRECSSQDKQDFLQYIFEAFPNGSPFVERELVGSIRIILNFLRTQCPILSGHILSKLIRFTLGVLRTTNADLRRETCQLCASKLEAFYHFCPLTSKEDRKYTEDGNIILSQIEVDYYRQLLTLMEYQTTLINELSRKPDQTLQRIFVLELHDLLIRSLSRIVYYYQPFIDFIWKKYSPAVISFLGSPIIDARCIMYVKNNASDPHLRRTVYRIILNLICFIAPIGSLRTVSETLFQRLCLSQTTNERSDLLIVLNEVITSRSLISLISPPWIHSIEATNDSDLSLFRKIISIIAECSSSDDRILVNNSYLCLNHCLEQLIKFCDDALFFDHDEEQAIRKIYKKFGYPIVPLSIDTNNLLNLIKNEKICLKEIYLTADSSTLEKVQFYIYHLKILLKTSDQQHITTVSDFDDALLQFSSFISNEYSAKMSFSCDKIYSFIFSSQFFQQGNFQSAIGVYNHAVRVFPKMPMLYSNRAACHFQVRNMIKCVEDCSRALELLDPPVLDNLPQRIKARIRRGTAFCELELYAEGLLDYEAAQKLSPDDDKIKEDAQRI